VADHQEESAWAVNTGGDQHRIREKRDKALDLAGAGFRQSDPPTSWRLANASWRNPAQALHSPQEDLVRNKVSGYGLRTVPLKQEEEQWLQFQPCIAESIQCDFAIPVVYFRHTQNPDGRKWNTQR
jgi:hypothetical protein